MGEILSQEEIDALLSAISEGELDLQDESLDTDEAVAKVYDFKHPDKFSQEHLRTLRMLSENWGRSLSSFLSSLGRALVNVKVASVQSTTFSEFISSLPSPTIIARVEVEPLDGLALFELNPPIAAAMIERLLGGPGTANRTGLSFTEIELTLIGQIVEGILQNLGESWTNVIELEPKAVGIENNPRFIQICAPNETVALITLDAELYESEGMINLCLPYPLLEPVLPKLTTRQWFSIAGDTDNSAQRARLELLLQDVPVTVTAVLGKSELSVRELLDFSLGDVIPLDRKWREPVDLLVNGMPTFRAAVGRLGGRLAVRIVDYGRTHGEDEVDEET